jgi:hypothetical protein
MRRREFVKIAALPSHRQFAARAQQKAMPVVGILGFSTPSNTCYANYGTNPTHWYNIFES